MAEEVKLNSPDGSYVTFAALLNDLIPLSTKSALQRSRALP